MILTSVIIPSHNRKSILCQTLNALAKQTYPPDKFEVIVVLDGCEDGSFETLGNYTAPFRLQIIEQNQKGAATARNQGASMAKGELLIFLDDDIETSPGFIQAHVEAHLDSENRVVIGNILSAPPQSRNYFALELQSWWESTFAVIARPGHRYFYTDMLSGNFSIHRELFQSLGGFDPTFTVHEDYELGWRLIQADVAMVFSQAALGMHHEQSDLQKALNRKYQEGIADVRLGQLYPELIPTLLLDRLAFSSRLLSHVFQRLEQQTPQLGKFILSVAFKMLHMFEKMRILWLWRQILYSLLGHWYLKGVAQELPTWRVMQDFLTPPCAPEPTGQLASTQLDLSLGLDHAELILDSERPYNVALYYEDCFIDRMPAQPGAERWRGEHLRAYLVNHALVPLLQVFSQKGLINLVLSAAEIEALCHAKGGSEKRKKMKDWR